MLEKLKRKRVDKQDDTRPINIEQLIEKYGLEGLWDYIDKIVDYSNTKVDESIIDKIYPIGSIYMSVNSTNPSNLFGGTWEAWGSGRIPVGVDINDTDFDTVEETGGSKTHNHTLQNAYACVGKKNGSTSWVGFKTASTTFTSSESISGSSASNPDSKTTVATALEGTTDNTSSLQPYITCYMWKRIS